MNPYKLTSKLDNDTPLTGEEAKYLIDLVQHHEEEVRNAVEAERARIADRLFQQLDAEPKLKVLTSIRSVVRRMVINVLTPITSNQK